MTRLSRFGLGMLLAVLCAAPARGQAGPVLATATDWAHGTTVAVTGGTASAASDQGATIGGALGWELTPRLMLEGSGLWLDRRGTNDAFNAAIKVRGWLRRSGASPFVEGGFGLYRVVSSTPATLPEFYRRRAAVAAGPLSAAVSFTDPVWHGGAGLNVFVSRHVAVQPALEALIVCGGGSTYTMTVASVRLAYHFEDHPVTP